MEEYAYREAVGEEIESPARRVEYCLEWLREEFPESTADGHSVRTANRRDAVRERLAETSNSSWVCGLQLF